MNKFIKQAFTLIELLVVIAIIGILSGLIVVSMSGVTQKATIAKAQVFSNSLRNALMSNIVGEWKFDELTTATEGTSIRDSWGGANNGTLDTYASIADPITNKVSADCVSGKCLNFDGTDDYIYVSGSDSVSSLLAITGEITLSAWVKFNDIGTSRSIVGRGLYESSNGNYGYGLRRYSATNKIYWYTHSETVGNELPTSTVFTDTNWHLITATWDGTAGAQNKKIYVDGVINNTTTASISVMGQPAYQFRIGSDGNNSYFFKGLIDDIRVYNVAASAFQVREQYYAGLNKLLANGGITSEEYQNRIGELAIR